MLLCFDFYYGKECTKMLTFKETTNYELFSKQTMEISGTSFDLLHSFHLEAQAIL